VAADFRRDGVRTSLIWMSCATWCLPRRQIPAGRRWTSSTWRRHGGLAVRFATLGHNVTVVDPSPDASRRRSGGRRGGRAADRGPGDAASLDTVAGTKAADLVICHNVLEYVDSPTDAMTAIAAVLRPSATVSVLASNAVAAVLHQALAGRFAEAGSCSVPTPPPARPGGSRCPR